MSEEKVEYVLQKLLTDGKLSDILKGPEKSLVFDHKKRAKEFLPTTEFRIVKRTTIDEVVE